MSLLITAGVLFLLVTGSPLLEKGIGLQGKIPLGNLITWIGVIALPMTIYWGIAVLRRPNTKFQVLLALMLKILIILGVLWAPVAYLLSGNPNFNF
ncbi:hypothetical protein [Croceiramulus getboli]|nr:hypothetical protein P8624_01050 [Flavobacteriaceae bacterium YJPT1-3]